MINMDLGKEDRYAVLFGVEQSLVGKGQLRTTVVCDVYTQDAPGTPLGFVTRGVSILNPLDTFNEAVGAHKAIASATKSMPWLSHDQRQKMHSIVEDWVYEA